MKKKEVPDFQIRPNKDGEDELLFLNVHQENPVEYDDFMKLCDGAEQHKVFILGARHKVVQVVGISRIPSVCKLVSLCLASNSFALVFKASALPVLSAPPPRTFRLSEPLP